MTSLGTEGWVPIDHESTLVFPPTRGLIYSRDVAPNDIQVAICLVLPCMHFDARKLTESKWVEHVYARADHFDMRMRTLLCILIMGSDITSGYTPDSIL